MDFVLQAVHGSARHAPVQFATTAEVVISGPGSIDGAIPADGQRVLVKDQTDPVQNGIYIVTGTELVRAGDANQTGELAVGTWVDVEGGLMNANTTWSVGFVGGSGQWDPGFDAITWQPKLQGLTFRGEIVGPGTLTVTHGLGTRYVVVSVYDSNGYKVDPVVQCVDESTLIVTIENEEVETYTVVCVA